MQYTIIKPMYIDTLKYGTKYTYVLIIYFKLVWLIIIYIQFEYLQVIEDNIIVRLKIIIFLFLKKNIMVD